MSYFDRKSQQVKPLMNFRSQKLFIVSSYCKFTLSVIGKCTVNLRLWSWTKIDCQYTVLLLLQTPYLPDPWPYLYSQLVESIAFFRNWMWPRRMARMEFHLVFCANAHPSCRPFSLDCSVSFSKLKIFQNPGSIRLCSPSLRAEIAPILQITARSQSHAPFWKFLRPF